MNLKNLFCIAGGRFAIHTHFSLLLRGRHLLSKVITPLVHHCTASKHFGKTRQKSPGTPLPLVCIPSWVLWHWSSIFWGFPKWCWQGLGDCLVWEGDVSVRHQWHLPAWALNQKTVRGTKGWNVMAAALQVFQYIELRQFLLQMCLQEYTDSF